jgi:hypothetical protein
MEQPQPTEKGTYFVDKIPQVSNREFKMVTGRVMESKPIACRVIHRLNGRAMIEYANGSGTSMKWINEDQLITV